jgi:hypothetical protein
MCLETNKYQYFKQNVRLTIKDVYLKNTLTVCSCTKVLNFDDQFWENACHALLHAGLLTTLIVIVRRNVGYKRRFIRPQPFTDTSEPPKM